MFPVNNHKDEFERREGKENKIEDNIEKDLEVRIKILNSKREFHLPMIGGGSIRSIAQDL